MSISVDSGAGNGDEDKCGNNGVTGDTKDYNEGDHSGNKQEVLGRM